MNESGGAIKESSKEGIKAVTETETSIQDGTNKGMDANKDGAHESCKGR